MVGGYHYSILKPFTDLQNEVRCTRQGREARMCMVTIVAVEGLHITVLAILTYKHVAPFQLGTIQIVHGGHCLHVVQSPLHY